MNSTTLNRVLTFAVVPLLLSCVTINIYFPEAAAQQAADRIIDEVRGAGDVAPESGAMRDFPTNPGYHVEFATRLLDWLVPAAHAQANFDVSSPATRALEQSLKSRFGSIKPFLDSGAVGLSNDGLLEIRDRNAVPLAKRNTLLQLVSAQNSDWEALYKEIANINGHPEWVAQIRRVFAERWVAKANGGWYYRNAGGAWVQK